MVKFEKERFVYDYLHNPLGHITHLFIAHPLSIKLAKVFSNIFVMDCTYKINKYSMPLLDIIGVSCFNTSFYSGFVFLERERMKIALSVFKKTLENCEPSVIMSDRELALMNAIKMVFPNTTNLLCIWHIEKNVLANCNKHFTNTEEFDIFMSNWNNQVAIEYIKNTWLLWKEKFVSAWTENNLHFGNRSSLRTEGAHSKLKSYLQVSTGGFQGVTEKICLAIRHEFNEIKVKLANEKIKVLLKCDTPVFRELLYHLSHFALKEIHIQYEKIYGTMVPCTGHFMATMGLPFAHKIQHLLGMKLSLNLIHPYWRIDTLRLNSEDDSHNDGVNKFDELLTELSSRYQMWPLSKKEFVTSMINKLLTESDTLFEPMIRRPKGRPPKSKKKKSMRPFKI
uniref:MULE transposase domain-containing protein n=1 Tax=Lactuca sativa TaxID=4236 RepID=A0A9R1V4K3_LACSA|nr:hypothetical protein LSAT_V11C700356530 [Lactuca sativa]